MYRRIKFHKTIIILCFLIIINLVFLVKSTISNHKETSDKWSSFDNSSIYDFLKKNKRTEYLHRKELIAAERPLGFVNEILTHLKIDDSGDGHIDLWLILPEGLKEELWVLEYGSTKITGTKISENIIPNTKSVYSVKIRFDINESAIGNNTIYINFENSRDILISYGAWKDTVKALDSINRKVDYTDRVF